MRKKIFIVTLTAAALFGGAEMVNKVGNQGFKCKKIIASSPHEMPCNTRPLTNLEQSETDHALSQTYSYLDRGCQSYAFVSSDDKYVVKFVKHTSFRPPILYRARALLPLKYQPKFAKKFNRYYKKRERLYNSYLVAFNHLPNETGLICLQLNTDTEQFTQKLKVKDRLGIPHTIDLNRVAFVLQRKAELLQPTIENLMREGRESEAKECFHEIANFFVRRKNKGFSDWDHILDRNFGFIDGKLVQIDIGTLEKGALIPPRGYPVEMLPQIAANPRNFPEIPLLRKNEDFRDWLMKNYPQLVETYDQQIDYLFEQKIF